MAHKYMDLDGNSQIEEYDFTSFSITIKFRDGVKLLFTHRTPGKTFVDELIACARKGRGLDNYIQQNVKSKYERKLA